MNLKERLQVDLVHAMKTHDETSKWVVKMIKSAIQLAEVAKGSELNQDELLAIVQKEIKTRQETKADAEKAQRQDMVAQADQEIACLKTYLPAQLNTEELTELARTVIVQCNATSSKDMGVVMKTLQPLLAGRASNAEASRVVRELLTG
ncbi:MAG TPA: GatB/YqeY domain-containing protein [Anaerolineaceae bacterium]|nr:GatB/YqeY domain-containing protein [Anaerolineaceae bacterium]